MKLKINYKLLLVLGMIFLFRLPSFFEPYYDGDEGVYYILGQMITRGAILYRDIWDNKTPLIYYLYSLHPTLAWAKLSATLFVLGTSLGAYFFAKKLKINSLLAALITGIFLSLPSLAGNTANAELYFTLPIVWGAYFIWQRKWPVLIGLLTSIAFLFKVPAILDFGGMFMATFLLRRELKFYLKMVPTFIIPILGFGIYYYFNRALPDFILAAFSQNSTYVSVYTGPLGRFGSPLIIHGLELLLVVFGLFFLQKKEKISKELFFLTSWLGFSIYAALLSGRPYEHYFLQVIPPLTLLFIYVLGQVKKYWWVVFVMIIGLVPYVKFLHWEYYQNFFDYVSERESWTQYQSFFGQDNVDAYKAAAFLKENSKKDEPAFVWGENDYIYILSGRPPATKFIRAHHLSTIDKKNYDLIVERLKKFQPKYIFVTRPVSFAFPQLETFLKSNYRPVQVFGNYYVYQNIAPVTPPPWKPTP